MRTCLQVTRSWSGSDCWCYELARLLSWQLNTQSSKKLNACKHIRNDKASMFKTNIIQKKPLAWRNRDEIPAIFLFIRRLSRATTTYNLPKTRWSTSKKCAWMSARFLKQWNYKLRTLGLETRVLSVITVLFKR